NNVRTSHPTSITHNTIHIKQTRPRTVPGALGTLPGAAGAIRARRHRHRLRAYARRSVGELSGVHRDFVDIIEALPRVLKHATGPVDIGALGMYLKVDDKRHSRILKRLDAIKQS
ncbi:MAG: hypothetical protein U1C73_17955, partial [Dietzia sp.]|nr:hypothetical protein [Dietzia sp.]